MSVKKSKFKSYLLYSLYIIGLTILFLEIILRIYYPFQRKIRGDHWEFATNLTYRFKNDFNPRLDSVIINHRNSIGFRGENPDHSIVNKFTVLTIGGSTTACTFLSEGKTWTDRLGVKLKRLYPDIWINNAGVDGHSTYGHLNFLYHYLPTLSFRPRIAIFLVGANDVDRDDLVVIDSSYNNNFVHKAKKWLKNNSETVNFLYDLKWIIHPVNIFTDKQNWSFTHFKSIHLSKGYIDSALQEQETIVHNFKARLKTIIDVCRNNDIRPVFVTQPLVFGDGTVDGGNPAIDFHVFHETENGQLFWKKLQLYNNATREIAGANNIPYIDLATLMPKDTLYYYDIVHYTNEGAQKVADIIFEGLQHDLTFSNYTK